MKGLVMGFVIGHVRNYNFILEIFCEGANVCFGPYSRNMHDRDTNDPAYERSHRGVSSETNRKFELYSKKYLWRSKYIFCPYFGYISLIFDSRDIYDPAYESYHEGRSYYANETFELYFQK